MMLTGTNLAAAESVLCRSVAADNSFPTQTVYLAKTTDPVRNVRYVGFDNAVFENQVVGNFAVNRVDTNATSFTNLFGMMAGLDTFSLGANAFVPGALADSLTSYAGFILENSYGQTPALAFLEAGASGSYGTIVEPCNYTQKFPDALDYFYQARGFSLAEAYYQSVPNPYQGLMVGEPLAAPFARPGGADWSSLGDGDVLSGQTNLNIYFTAATNLPLAQADLYVDGTFFQTMTNLPPAPGNVITVIMNGLTNNYTVPTNATLATAAAGLANNLNLQTNLTHVLAFPAGDRIGLQSLAVTNPGANVTVRVAPAIGSAAQLTTRLTAVRPVFLDSVAKGFQVVTIWKAPSVGDWLQFTFIKTNGTTVTIGVTNTTTGTAISTLAQNLLNLVNATPALESADGVFAADFYAGYVNASPAVQFALYARASGWPASQIQTTLNTSTNLQSFPAGTNPLADNLTDLRPRNHLYLSSGLGLLPVNFAFDTTQLPDGWHQLTAVACEGTSVATQTRVTRTVQIQNTSLAATLTALPAGTNTAQLQFTVSANATNIARIELFSTGGSVGVVTNQAMASLAVSTAYLGLGLHPFYALVTDQAGHRYQTQAVWSIIPVITLALVGLPPALAWPAIPGRQYDLQSTTNLAASFQTMTTITATNSVIQWPIITTGNAEYYRVKLDP